MREIVHATFESEIIVRPDDIDMNGHVHSSRYFDYVQAARYDQMLRCYRMPMEEFLSHGYSWVVRSANIHFKRSIELGDRVVVRTRVDRIVKDGASVWFEILKSENRKVACDGHFHYTMVDITTGRAVKLPDWVVEMYSV